MKAKAGKQLMDYSMFLQVFQDYPVLWDVGHKDHNDKVVYKRCFQQLRIQLDDLNIVKNVTDDNLMKRMKYVLEVYSKERTKMLENLGEYIPNQKWILEAGFLDKSMDPHPNTYSLSKRKRKFEEIVDESAQLSIFSLRSSQGSQMDFSQGSNSQMDYSEPSNSQIDYSETGAFSMKCSQAESNIEPAAETEEFDSLESKEILLPRKSSDLMNVPMQNVKRNSATLNSGRNSLSGNTNQHGATVTPEANPKLPGDAFLNYVVSEFQDLSKEQARDLQDEIYKCISRFRKNIEQDGQCNGYL